MNADNEKQVKSKKRVVDHGEVFTADREVNAMLDLVKHETERIDSRFLEPACGTGNFLVEILLRKLEVVENGYSKSQFDFERNAVIAVSSIYGVDILEDNVLDCRKRLFNIFDSKYTLLYKDNCKEDCRNSIRFILNRNILWGDALSLKTVCGKQEPIVFSEWSAVNGSQIKRRDFTFEELIDCAPLGGLFISDMGDDVFIPRPIREFPLIHFLKLDDHDKEL